MPRDLTQSEYQIRIYDLSEFKFEGSDQDALEGEKDDIVGQLEELRDEQQEKLDNMPEGLKEGNSGQLLQERIDNLEGYIAEFEAVDISSFDEDKPDEGDEGLEKWEEDRGNHFAAIRDELNQARDGIS